MPRPISYQRQRGLLMPKPPKLKLTRLDVWQLGGAFTCAGVAAILLRTRAPLAEDVASNMLAQAVREDRSSPEDNNPSSDLRLIVFTDYGCPACRASHPAMKSAVAGDGKVQIVYKDWPVLGERSRRAAEVAIASDMQGIYFLVHDALMRLHPGSETGLRAAVEQSGGDWRRSSDLLEARPRILEQLALNRRQAFELGLSGTPGYLIGSGLVRGAVSEGQFTRLFRDARKRLERLSFKAASSAAG
jgi:protein-disulfide isomerase